jgi:hypothetical protein
VLLQPMIPAATIAAARTDDGEADMDSLRLATDGRPEQLPN